jgi:enterochelin esterase-like enzyme
MIVTALLAGFVVSVTQTSTAWKPPYEVLPPRTDASELAAHLSASGSAVWLEGDTLHFLVRSKEELVRLTGAIQQPLSQVEGTDLWILSLKMPDWETCAVPYAFYTTDGMGEKKVWRGKRAPDPVVKAEKLQGRIIERTIHSINLGADRGITVYLPPNAPKEHIPTFFMADGQDCESFAKVLEPLILGRRVRPVAILGVHNGGVRGPDGQFGREFDFRAKEYIAGQEPDRFEKHMRFFAEEVPAWASREFNVSTKRQDRAVFGYSNGGAFAQAIAQRHPGLFAAAMPLSTGIPLQDPKPPAPLPAFYYAAGKLERFSVPTAASYEKAKSWGAKATYKTYFGGHEEATWLPAFTDFAPLIFPRDM